MFCLNPKIVLEIPSKKNYKDTEIKAILTQTDLNKIPLENIKWKIEGKDNESKDGTIKLTVPANDEVVNSTFTNISGYPILTTKEVKIKWIKEDRKDASFMPPAVSYLVTRFNENLVEPLKGFTDILDKATGTKPGEKQNFKVEIKPIKIKGKKYNEEDKNSRHYFEITKGSINGGISLKGEFFGYPPFLKFLNIDEVSKVGFFVSPKFEANLIGARLMKTIGETNKKQSDSFIIEGDLKECIEVGVKGELLVGKDAVEFSVSGSGEGCASGKKHTILK